MKGLTRVLLLASQAFLEANQLRLILRSHEGPDARDHREEMPQVRQTLTYTHTHTDTHAHTHRDTWACSYTGTQMRTFTYMLARMLARVYEYNYKHSLSPTTIPQTPPPPHTQTRTFTNTHAHICTHTHTHNTHITHTNKQITHSQVLEGHALDHDVAAGRLMTVFRYLLSARRSVEFGLAKNVYSYTQLPNLPANIHQHACTVQRQRDRFII
jgi:hypothetical protein